MRGKDKTSKRLAAAGIAKDNTVCFLGREREAHRLQEALEKKESMLISGPADMGKTALMQYVLQGLPKDVGGRCLYLANFKDLRDLLRKLLKALYHAGSPALRQQLRAEGVPAARLEGWLKTLSSPRLKGTLYRAVEHGDYRIILDHVPPLTPAVARVIKELFWMRATPVYLLVRDTGRIDRFSRFFYWGRRQRMALGPLPKPNAGELLERCIRRFGLTDFDMDEFRDDALGLSGCVPGAIVTMCAMAADNRYQSGVRIKTKLVHIDYLMNGSKGIPKAGR
jgi:AAA ATPase domain